MLLENITSPKDIKKLSIEELEILSGEIRNRIIEVLSTNGGHLASNLGIVELTLALHFVFNSPYDKFIFDVSHQIYTHKLITGRNKKFDSLRQYKGISGFSNPKESPHDHFQAGHAGVAISLGLGLCKNRDFLKRDEHIIPIIGDATLTCGLALEGLNNIDAELKKYIIILNDNKMAISENVGNIKSILSRLLNNPISNKLYTEMQTLLSKIPNFGNLLAKQGKKVTESLKNLVSPASFFEQQNLSYIGPIDGHNIKKLIETFNSIKDNPRPVIVHVMTSKGKGMEKAILNPTSYHGVKPFDLKTGDFKSISKLTFPKVFGKHVLAMAKSDPNIIVINPAMIKGSSLTDLKNAFPNRCIDVGIAEGHAITLAGGIAFNNNLKVIVNIYSTFLQRSFDNIFHDICLQHAPVVFAIDRSGLSGPDGSTHHGIYDISFLNAMPNIVIAQPRNGNLLKELLSSVFDWKKTVAIRYPNLETQEEDLPLRKLNEKSYDILNTGSKILIIAIGHMYKTAQEVNEILKQNGYNATILDPIFIKPLNKELLQNLTSLHDYVITIEEHSVTSGFGSIYNNFLVQYNLRPKQVLNFGLQDEFIEHGRNDELL
ncbi:MAG: 1-deoxy-D-xylulose-5-phosphate synthase, partial [Parachlamydiales bacterium]